MSEENAALVVTVGLGIILFAFLLGNLIDAIHIVVQMTQTVLAFTIGLMAFMSLLRLSDLDCPGASGCRLEPDGQTS